MLPSEQVVCSASEYSGNEVSPGYCLPTEEDLDSWEASKPMRERSPVTQSCCWVNSKFGTEDRMQRQAVSAGGVLGGHLIPDIWEGFWGRQHLRMSLWPWILLGFFCHGIYHSLTIFKINYWVQFSVSFKDLEFSLEIRFSSGILSSLWHQWLLG